MGAMGTGQRSCAEPGNDAFRHAMIILDMPRYQSQSKDLP